MFRSLRFAATALVVLIAGNASALTAQCIQLSTLEVASTQDFNTLSSTAGTTTNVLAIPGWFLTESGGGARDNEQYAVDTGGSGTGDTYSYGATANSDRALGGLQSGTLIPTFGACFTNDTGETIAAIAISYVGEEWRLGTAGRTDQLDFQYSLDATSLSDGTWTDHNALDFVTPNTVTGGAKDGNSASNQATPSSTVTCLDIPPDASFWIRWSDFNATSSDDGLAVDTFSLTPQASGGACLTVDDVTVTEGESGTVLASFTVTLSEAAGPGGVTFDIATQDGTATTADSDYVDNDLLAQTIPAGSSAYAFDVTVNGDTNPEIYETFTVAVTNVSGATVFDGVGEGVIQSDDPTITPIHVVQGSPPLTPGTVVTLEGVVTASFQTQGSGELRGFFLQEEDIDADSDPQTSEGLFVFCSSCPTAVAEGERVRATGTVSEFDNMTQITASTAPAVLVTEAGDHLADVSAVEVDLPIADATDVDDFYEPMEGMLVTFSDTLTVAEYFELFRYGQVELYQGGRPRQYTEDNLPDVDLYADHLAALDRRRVILDDDDNIQNGPLSLPETLQYVYHPRQNGGFSVGTQGIDYFRGGDQVSELTGVLHWSESGLAATDAWRIRPTAANDVALTVVNPRSPSAPAVGNGTITAASMNLLNYFSTLDTSNVCSPSLNQDCRGADSAAELARQRARTALVICTLSADVYGLVELENTTASGAIDDLLTAVNTQCGGSDPYVFASTGGTLGTDAIRVAIIYRSATLAPQGAPLSDLDAVHNRPPTAQTFEVIEPGNPALGEVFTVVANHFKSKGCGGASGLDLDQNDGQSCFNATRTAQAQRLLTWLTGTVVPAAGDDDVLLLGDFNAYAKEDPITALVSGLYDDLVSSQLGTSGYSYLFDGQLGHLDYALASPLLADRVTGVAPWHINADEVPLFDYNDEIREGDEATFEEKPDGSALTPPRTMFEPGVPYRAADHDPVLVGLFPPPAPAMTPHTLVVDDAGNDVLEAGEAVLVQPAWENLGTAMADDLTGTASVFTGPAGPTYDIVDGAALYGDVAPLAIGSCAGNADCYTLEIDAASRPQQHWDASFDEELSTGETHTWTLHVGESFLDVATTGLNYSEIETLFHHGVVTGCGGGNYCPSNPISREQFALLMIRALGVATPPACLDGAAMFSDVAFDDPYCPWIEEMADPTRLITLGCGANNYCPKNPVTREQMAMLVLRAVESPGYVPPACGVTPQTFTDVPASHAFCDWIEEFARRGGSGCGDGNFCPALAIDRAQLAPKLTFDLALYTP